MTMRRKLQVGPDGMADVLVLTDPIPRHLSLVSWGANDSPAVSWKTADPVASAALLRAPPSMIDMSAGDLSALQEFLSTTLDAWRVVIEDTLARPLSQADRAARVSAITAQAGARAAAVAAAIGHDTVAAAAAAYKPAELKLPAPPAESTLQGELDRRQFMAGVENAAAAVMDQVLAAMREAGPRSTERILHVFGEAGDAMASWAAALPAGVVGVRSTASERPVTTHNAGARNNKSDTVRLREMRKLLDEIDPDGRFAHIPGQSAKNQEGASMNIADLQKIASEDPEGFLSVLKNAMKAVSTSKGPKESRKFMWGETGVDPFDPDAFLSDLRIQGGPALQSLIASAVAGVDLAAGTGTGVTVAATMRSGIAKLVAHELTNNPTGDLAVAVKAAIAPSFKEALRHAFGQQNLSQATNPAGLGGFDFSAKDGDADPWTAEIPGRTGFGLNNR